MKQFHSDREAMDYLVGEIAQEAARQGRPLADVERKMLYFSETDWTLPDIAEVDAAFDREYDQEKYERRIAALARAARKRAGKAGSAAWSEAVKRGSSGDHYLLVMVGQSGDHRSMTLTWRHLVAALLVIGVVVAGQVAFSAILGRSSHRDNARFFTWLTLVSVLAAYGLSRVAFGGRRVDAWVGRVIGWVFRLPPT